MIADIAAFLFTVFVLVLLVRHVPGVRVAAFWLVWQAYLLPLRARRLFRGE